MLEEKLLADMKTAMKSKDKIRLLTIRSLRAALKSAEIDARGSDDVTEEGKISILQKQAKQRRDAIEQYNIAGRQDLVDQEETELKIIGEYLPAQLSDDEIRSAVQAIIQKTGASSMADIGKVMGPAMGQLRGKADGKRVQMMVRELLG